MRVFLFLSRRRPPGEIWRKLYWYGAGTEILDESDGSGNITNEYVFFSGKRIAMDLVSGTGGGSISTTYYYAEDFLGSSRTMLQSGATSPCFDADFLPFGREKDAVATCTQNDYKFEGKERDTETGNDDFGARYYSSNFGRWLSPDWSAIPEPVPYANLSNPQTLNLYAMVEDDPESFADLDGHKIDPATANGICNTNNATGSCDDWEQSVIYNNTYDAWGYSPEQLAVFINDGGVTGEAYAVATNAEAAEALKAQTHGFWWNLAHDAGLIVTDADRVQEARQFLAANSSGLVYSDEQWQAVASMPPTQVLGWWKEYNQANQQNVIDGGRGLAYAGVGRLTAPQATDLAEYLGFRRVKVDWETHGQPVFMKNGRYISPDTDSHSGGTWKELDRRGNRIATLDWDLTRIGP